MLLIPFGHSLILKENPCSLNILSPTFTIYAIKYHLELSSENNGNIKLKLWLSLPSGLSSVTIRYKLSINEMNLEHINVTKFSHNIQSAEWNNLQLQKIKTNSNIKIISFFTLISIKYSTQN